MKHCADRLPANARCAARFRKRVRAASRTRSRSRSRMALDLAEVRRIARLARLAVSEDEARSVLVQLNEVFDMIEQMRAVDTTGIEPMSHPLGGVQRLREDVVSDTTDREACLANAPATEAGLYLVPRVLE